MFRVYVYLLLFAILSGISLPLRAGCRLYAKGKSLGAANAGIVGPEGGIVNSPDGRLQVIVPAGAIAAPTEISIQPITNTNPAGNGLAYRISPHTIHFIQPVTISINYGSNESSRLNPSFQRVAFQDEQGRWQAIRGGRNDTTKKVVSVKTTHFSDWSEFESMRLEPVMAAIATGESIQLRAIQYFSGDELVRSLGGNAGETTAIGDPIYILPVLLKNWQTSKLKDIFVSEKRFL